MKKMKLCEEVSDEGLDLEGRFDGLEQQLALSSSDDGIEDGDNPVGNEGAQFWLKAVTALTDGIEVTQPPSCCEEEEDYLEFSRDDEISLEADTDMFGEIKEAKKKPKCEVKSIISRLENDDENPLISDILLDFGNYCRSTAGKGYYELAF